MIRFDGDTIDQVASADGLWQYWLTACCGCIGDAPRGSAQRPRRATVHGIVTIGDSGGGRKDHLQVVEHQP